VITVLVLVRHRGDFLVFLKQTLNFGHLIHC
jgi:hypothetical protein